MAVYLQIEKISVQAALFSTTEKKCTYLPQLPRAVLNKNSINFSGRQYVTCFVRC